MNDLVLKIEELKKEINPLVDKRIKELEENNDWFSELCFCLLTANYSAEGGIKIQNSVSDFSKHSKQELEDILTKLGHRFPKARAGYLYLAKQHKNKLEKLKKMENSNERREWLVKNVKGLGYKESSHFLRNVGYLDVAIIDRHILAVLHDYGLIKIPKTITKKTYLKIEELLRTLALRTNTEIGELDFYLWYMKTGTVLK